MVTSSFRLTARDVDDAREAIRAFLPPSPLVAMADASGRRVFLKLECEQPTGSFKVRGALSNLRRQPVSPRGFVAASAGNHGLGVAWAAQVIAREEPVTIFVPESAPRTKIDKFAAYGVDLRITGETYDDAQREAHAFEAAEGARFIHAYDDPLTAAGQGTLAPEAHESLGAIGTIVIPVGGGGLISGCAAWLKERAPTVRVVAVQPEASPALSESIRLNRALLEFPAGPTLADGLSGGIGHVVFNHRDLIDEVLNVPEELILDSMRRLHRESAVRAEASGAIAAAALDLEASRAWPQPIVCVITGANVDPAVLARILV